MRFYTVKLKNVIQRISVDGKILLVFNKLCQLFNQILSKCERNSGFNGENTIIIGLKEHCSPGGISSPKVFFGVS